MSDAIDRAAVFLWGHGRVLERWRFGTLLGAVPGPEQVVTALAAYQNPDGGFGHALEPDIRTPLSQPQPAELALRLLHEVGASPAAVVDPLVRWLCDVGPDGTLPFAFPSLQHAPHAPWWAVDDDPPPNLNPTAAVAGMLHALGVGQPWRDKATAWCWAQVDAMTGEGGIHEVIAALAFLDHVDDRTRAKATVARLAPVITAGVELDPTTQGYVKFPLDLATTPHSVVRHLFDDADIETHLDALASRQQEDGGWPIAWEPPTAAAVHEWRGIATVEACKTLKAYGRLS